ncbi:MAG: cupin domain-containing protein [Acidobacteriaceae bacterium]|nr:cupin domain-containing protein [Acidobacteriaceae bacterium]
MSHTRRDLGLLLPALFAASRAKAELSELPSKCYAFDELPVEKHANQMETRNVFRGRTHTGCPLAMHISTLPAGQMPHPPHHHTHEEMMLVKDGVLEFTIAGKTCRVKPGSVVYINSNEEHGMKNIGETSAQYFVIEIGA